MKLIVGLGNYPEKYKNTRHNFGFLLADFLVQNENFSNFKLEKKFGGEIAIGEFQGEKTMILKPHTLMNLSGQAVQAVTHFYKISSQDIIVLSDDADLDFGKIRFRKKGGAGGHNGLKSLIQYLGNQDFMRLKLGISNDQRQNLPLDIFALQKFSTDEFAKIPQIMKNAYNLLLDNLK